MLKQNNNNNNNNGNNYNYNNINSNNNNNNNYNVMKDQKIREVDDFNMHVANKYDNDSNDKMDVDDKFTTRKYPQ